MTYKFSNQTNFVPNPTLPLIVADRNRPFVRFGIDNLYPSYLIELFNKSAIHRRAILSKVLGVFGQGLRTVDLNMESLLDVANSNGESWNDIFEKVVTDYEIHGGFSLQIIWNELGNKVVEMYHLPWENLRSDKIDPATGRVETYEYSTEWNNKRIKPIKYVAYNPSTASEFPVQVLCYFDYTPGSPYYPLPSYSGALQDINIDVDISNFHISNLSNGLNPSLWINFNQGPVEDPAAEQRLYSDVASAFSGSQNTGKVFMTFSDSKENAPDVTPIQSANDDYYVNLETRLTKRILSAHGITNPGLLGLYEGGNGLSSNKDELLVSYELFQTMVLEPDIRALLKPMNMLMKAFGYNTKLYIEPLQLFDGSAEQTEIA